MAAWRTTWASGPCSGKALNAGPTRSGKDDVPKYGFPRPAGSCGVIEFYLIEVKFNALKDPAERTYFKRLPTSFSLPSEEVDKLRQAAGRILNESRDFKRLLGDLQR